MDDQNEGKTKNKGGPRANVRFSEQEYNRLQRDERARGLSIPILLKEAYFEGRPTAILMTKEDQKSVLTELIRQGTNLNQIARQVNAGIAVNGREELGRIARALDGMMALLRGKVLQLKAAE